MPIASAGTGTTEGEGARAKPLNDWGEEMFSSMLVDFFATDATFFSFLLFPNGKCKLNLDVREAEAGGSVESLRFGSGGDAAEALELKTGDCGRGEVERRKPESVSEGVVRCCAGDS